MVDINIAEIKKKLGRYSGACIDFLRENGIETSETICLIPFLLLSFKDNKCNLYNMVIKGISGEKKTTFRDEIINTLNNNGNEKKIIKTAVLQPEMKKYPKGGRKYFEKGRTVLDALAFSLYNNVTKTCEDSYNDGINYFLVTLIEIADNVWGAKGVVFTPDIVTEKMLDIAEYYSGNITSKTTILDSCCGTGGILSSYAKRAAANGKKDYKGEGITGIDINNIMCLLAEYIMRLSGLAKVKIINASSVLGDDNKKISDVVEVDMGIINPPYGMKNTQSELSFIKSMLGHLKKGGIGIALVPMACTGNKYTWERQIILKRHTLIACISLPRDLFLNKKVAVNTCIMVFQAHVPHQKNSQVSFVDWTNKDYFSGEGIVNDLSGKNKGISVKKKLLSIEADCSVEANIDTDYSSLNDKLFDKQVKKYALYRYKKSKGMLNAEADEQLWLLDHIEEFNELYQSKETKKIILNIAEWKSFNIQKLFKVESCKYTAKADLKTSNNEKLYPYISSKKYDNGVEGLYCNFTEDGNVITVDSATDGYVYYQPESFSAASHVEKLVPLFDMDVYVALFIITVLNMESFRYSYGRKWNKKRIKATSIMLPAINKTTPDYKFMKKYIMSLPYSKNL